MTTNNDPCRITAAAGADGGHGTPAKGVSRGQVARTLLWTVLVISVVTNAVASFAGASAGVHLACGAVTAVCVAIVVANVLRRRR